MIELAFVACMAAAPRECENYSLLFTEITPMTCMMGAQPELAKWVAAHPNLQVKSWKCRVVSFAERDA